MRYGRYKIIKELGKGAMGVVYQAHDPNIDRMVALKVLRPDRVTDKTFVARFMKEAKAIGRLSHPGIVTVYDVGEDQGTVYIAMEYVTGRPLDEIIGRGNLTVEQSAEIACQVAEALDYAHGKGIVHRDIKPSNILVNQGNRIKLTDFGIARIEDPAAGTMTQAGEILGTPAYMSPEQVKGKTVDGRSDLFSLAVILYELVAGKRPFGGSNLPAIFHSIARDEPEPPEQLDPFISKKLSQTIIKAMAKEPDQRFQTGREMALAIRKAVNPQAQTTPPAAPRAKTGQGRKAWPALAAGAVVIAALVAWLVIKPGPGNNMAVESSPASGTTISTSQNQKAALLQITSEPSGADIFINGTFRGKTPLDLELPLGKYEVALNKPKFYEWEAQLQFDESGPNPIHVRLVPIQ